MSDNAGLTDAVSQSLSFRSGRRSGCISFADADYSAGLDRWRTAQKNGFVPTRIVRLRGFDARLNGERATGPGGWQLEGYRRQAGSNPPGIEKDGSFKVGLPRKTARVAVG